MAVSIETTRANADLMGLAMTRVMAELRDLHLISNPWIAPRQTHDAATVAAMGPITPPNALRTAVSAAYNAYRAAYDSAPELRGMRQGQRPDEQITIAMTCGEEALQAVLLRAADLWEAALPAEPATPGDPAELQQAAQAQRQAWLDRIRVARELCEAFDRT